MNLPNTQNALFQSYFNNYRCQQQSQPPTYQTQTQQDQIQLPNRNSRVDITITTNKYTLSDLRNGDNERKEQQPQSDSDTLVKKANGDNSDLTSVCQNGSVKGSPSSASYESSKIASKDGQETGPLTGDTSPFDEKKEWAKISEIMESFGSGLVRESVFINEVEDEFKKRLISKKSDAKLLNVSVQTPLQAFLNGIGLMHLVPLLEESGFDNVDFLVSVT